MAYGKKKQAKGMVNRNPWTRDSQDNPMSVKRKPFRRSPIFHSRMLTGSPRTAMRNTSSPSMGKQVERRGGPRRAPFLSNTGPGKKY